MDYQDFSLRLMRKCLNGKSHIGFRVPWLWLHSARSTHRLKKASTAFVFSLQPEGKKTLSESAWASLNWYKDTEEESEDLILWSNSPSRPVLQVVFLKQQALRLIQVDTTPALSVNQSKISQHPEMTCVYTTSNF